MRRFSFNRWWGIVSKEFLQLRRDRITFGMIVGIPIVQLLLFGYAINTEPKRSSCTIGMPTIIPKVMRSRRSWRNSLLTIPHQRLNEKRLIACLLYTSPSPRD